MHELSIALSIIDLVLDEPAVIAGARVQAVHISMGALAGVAKDALTFSYEVASQDGPLAGSQLVVEEVPVLVFCPHCDCHRSVEPIYSVCCAVCGRACTEVVQGKELSVAALEILE